MGSLVAYSGVDIAVCCGRMFSQPERSADAKRSARKSAFFIVHLLTIVFGTAFWFNAQVDVSVARKQLGELEFCLKTYG